MTVNPAMVALRRTGATLLLVPVGVVLAVLLLGWLIWEAASTPRPGVDLAGFDTDPAPDASGDDVW